MRISNAPRPLLFAGLLIALPLVGGCGPGEVAIGTGPASGGVTLASGGLNHRAAISINS
jgi:hypothetical protein